MTHIPTSNKNPYRGRFAPSPTGPLHFGSLIAATGSYLDARANNGQWLVRMEDLDPPRCMPGAADSILKALDHYGFEWDEEVVYQSQRNDRYEAAMSSLRQQELLYPCTCTRKAIIERCAQGEYGAIYDGHCRSLSFADTHDFSTRIKVTGEVTFEDAIQGRYTQNLETDIGDFHLLRRDGLFAYHLGVTVDDALQNITHIVRGFDLLDSTPRQIYLQQQLGYITPHYAHLPLAIKPDGQKLSKQNLATALPEKEANHMLWQALVLLGQSPPITLQSCSLAEIWAWSFENWSLAKVPKQQGIPSPII